MPKVTDDTLSLLVTCPECTHSFNLKLNRGLLPNPAGSGRERMFRLSEVEDILGLSRRRLKQLIYDGKLRAERGKGATSPWFVPESAISEFRHSRNNR